MATAIILLLKGCENNSLANEIYTNVVQHPKYIWCLVGSPPPPYTHGLAANK